MFYNKALVENELRRWGSYLAQFALPRWEELPPLELYMDQVVALLGQYLEFLPAEEKHGKVVTPTAINNYVRMRIMPPPRKKKYSRIHIAYLIMICTLKQSVNIAQVQKMIPMGLPEDSVRTIYNGYVAQHKRVCTHFLEQVGQGAARDIAEEREAAGNEVNSFVTYCAVSAGFFKLLVDRIVPLQNMEPKAEQPAASKP